uniref:Uncharacterized protein n=1 Tax=Chromera velia CCMP2878 TaxID=1169474 RepID=A0A0G4FF34_9ALVE|eukprot:Cvel_16625.t1-p1 / transcript=Cvel_16625.t1 / gene=Cvel_16625 / organism=Chromera_velia_CCMP2878 / gene_product=hypothetical protein / transcript_product=hypothetical protein / location=Cvel_scaffold1288:44271-45005(-) / protein_length=245 / sequence_SO=supercontig / SO=protein_coding / is_pseudo=false
MAPKRRSAEQDSLLSKDPVTFAAGLPKGSLDQSAKKLRQILEAVEKRSREEGEDPMVEAICAELRDRFTSTKDQMMIFRKIVNAVNIRSAKEYISMQEYKHNEETVEVEWSLFGEEFRFYLCNTNYQCICDGYFDLAFLGEGNYDNIDRRNDPFGIEESEYVKDFGDVTEAKEWAKQLKIPARQMSPGMLARIVCVTVCLKASQVLEAKGLCGDEMSKKFFNELMHFATPEEAEDLDFEEEEGKK